MHQSHRFFHSKPLLEFAPIQLRQFLHIHRDLVSLPFSSCGGSRVVVRTSSNDIYENLAVEEALLRGLHLQKGNYLLLLYMNAPCVVVGRNQNVLREVSMRQALEEGVHVARRSSGGGAVYHDEGNLCFSFFTHRNEYAPEKTIQLVRAALSTAFGIPLGMLTTTKRHDLFLDGKKISGSAMRVQKEIAYHHCTLLLSSSRRHLGRYLKSEADTVFFQSAAVASVRSPVTTIKDELRASGDPGSFSGDGCANAFRSVPFSKPYFFEGKKKENSLLLRPLHFMSYMADFFQTHSKQIMMAGEDVLDGIVDAVYPSAIPFINSTGKEDFDLPSSSEKGQGSHSPSTVSSCFHLDVEEAINSFQFQEGEGIPSGSKGNAWTLSAEVERIRALSWLWNMPKFESVISISAFQLQVVLQRLLSSTSSSEWGKRCLEISTLILDPLSGDSASTASSLIAENFHGKAKTKVSVRDEIIEELLNYLFPYGSEQPDQLLFVRSVVQQRTVNEIDCFRGRLDDAIMQGSEKEMGKHTGRSVAAGEFDSSKLVSLPFFSFLLSSVMKNNHADSMGSLVGKEHNELQIEEVLSHWEGVWCSTENEPQKQSKRPELVGKNDFSETLDLPASCHLPCAAVLLEAVILVWKRKNLFDSFFHL